MSYWAAEVVARARLLLPLWAHNWRRDGNATRRAEQRRPKVAVGGARTSERDKRKLFGHTKNEPPEGRQQQSQVWPPLKAEPEGSRRPLPAGGRPTCDLTGVGRGASAWVRACRRAAGRGAGGRVGVQKGWCRQVEVEPGEELDAVLTARVAARGCEQMRMRMQTEGAGGASQVHVGMPVTRARLLTFYVHHELLRLAPLLLL